MLRVTINQGPGEERWILQGRLSAPSVPELQTLWDKSRASLNACRRIVDLTDVTAIDSCGEQMLHAMRNAGAEFIASGVYTRHIVDVINRECQRSGEGELFGAADEPADRVALHQPRRKS